LNEGKKTRKQIKTAILLQKSQGGFFFFFFFFGRDAKKDLSPDALADWRRHVSPSPRSFFLSFLFFPSFFFQSAKRDLSLMRADLGRHTVLPSLPPRPLLLSPSFTFEHYISARAAISSRAFRVDSYHGNGLIPLLTCEPRQ